MKKNQNVILDATFNKLEVEKKLDILGITEETLTNPRFKNIELSVIINDIWNGRTNSEKRSILKNV